MFAELIVAALLGTFALFFPTFKALMTSQVSIPIWLLIVVLGAAALLYRVRERSLLAQKPHPSEPASDPRKSDDGVTQEPAATGAGRYPSYLDVADPTPERERVYVREESPKAILDAVEAIPPLNRWKVAQELYSGRWIKCAGHVREIRGDDRLTDDLYSVMVLAEQGGFLIVTFSIAERAKVEVLWVGDRVSVVGQILQVVTSVGRHVEVVHPTVTRLGSS